MAEGATIDLLTSTPHNPVQPMPFMSNPFVRAYLASVGLFIITALAMFGKHVGPADTFDWTRLVILASATAVVGLPIGLLMRRAKSPWSWVKLSAITFPFWLFAACVGVAAHTLIAKPPPRFKNPDEMMEYMAHQTTRWVKNDRDIKLDYSIESIKIVEQELSRISQEVDKGKPQEGTFGIAIGHGAYVGECLRRKYGGAWAYDHAVGGKQSFPLALKEGPTLFPVTWCYKRLIGGEEHNVYETLNQYLQSRSLITNATSGAVTN